jgi:hypothetical protein
MYVVPNLCFYKSLYTPSCGIVDVFINIRSTRCCRSRGTPESRPCIKRPYYCSSKGRLPPREPSLEFCRVVRLPEACTGPASVFLFIEDPEIEQSTMDPRCLGGLLNVPRDGLPKPTRVVPMEATLSCGTLVTM